VIIRLIQSAFAVAAGRSSRWPSVRKAFLAGKRCAACNARNPEAHHVTPFHVAPDLELSTDNLLALCRRCHLLIGHCDSWLAWNAHARGDAALMFKRKLGRMETPL
jgi:hypothetical protein